MQAERISQQKGDSLMKPLLSTDDLIQHMKQKGIQFNLMSESDAKTYLENNNYFFKLASYRNNYTKRQRGACTGQYENLDFAYLRELAIIDMYLRYLVLQMCLDVEHHIKLMLISDMERNLQEDGYSVVNNFDFSQNIRTGFLLKARSSYDCDLIQKHQSSLDYPIYAFCELISFGELVKLYKFYQDSYPTRKTLPKFNLLYPIRNLRNASAHSNCLIYKLRGSPQTTVKDIDHVIAQIPTISKSARKKYLCVRPIHDFAVLLYWYSCNVKSKELLKKRKRALYELFFHRMRRQRTYFQSNQYISNAYTFCAKLIIYFFGKY